MYLMFMLQASTVVGVPVKKLHLSKSKENSGALTSKDVDDIRTLHGKTLFVL